MQTLEPAVACSDFVAQLATSQPQLVQNLLDSGDLAASYEQTHYNSQLKEFLKTTETLDALMQGLRQFRQREMLRIACRDLSGSADLNEVMNDLTNLADACVTIALEKLFTWQCEKYGTPYDKSNNPQVLTVIAVGKLGSKELNFSSDIDLIFAYADAGLTEKDIPFEQFYTEIAQQLIKTLSMISAGGFVFRVDMRLRPFGDSGPIVMSFDALKAYYKEHGRDWERYALARARMINGNEPTRRRLMNLVNTFVYRGYYDYSVLDVLRDMKILIAREVKIKGLKDDIKRGPGGIRQAEFIAHGFQLVRGGRDGEFRQKSVSQLYELIEARRLLTAEDAQALLKSYQFLRKLEHCLQMWSDQQTHSLPSAEEQQTALAKAMRFSCWEGFLGVLEQHRQTIQTHFDVMVEEPKVKHKLPSMLNKSVPAREILMPLLERATKKLENSEAVLLRLTGIVDVIETRQHLVSLLIENPKAIEHLVRLCTLSPWVCEHLRLHPILLDEFVDAHTLYAPLSTELLQIQLRQQLLSIPQSDLDQQMDTLRRFKHAQDLHVAAADLSGALPLMKVSDHLTFTAIAILRKVHQLAKQELSVTHGAPLTDSGETAELAIVAYGKLGGIELSYGSDLDLVFIHSGSVNNSMTDGATPISCQEFFIRLAQRVIQILNLRTRTGILYEVDTRLRPSGNAGLLATSVDAFADYQKTSAWTWEHQALVRARVVSGSEAISEQFNSIRNEILSGKRNNQELKAAICNMRAKMRETAVASKPDEFDVKQGLGAIADIEFIVQYAVLAWSAQHPELLAHPDNIRILEALTQAGLIAQENAVLLCDAYRAYREVVHHAVLDNRPATISADKLKNYSIKVQEIWNSLLGGL